MQGRLANRPCYTWEQARKTLKNRNTFPLNEDRTDFQIHKNFKSTYLDMSTTHTARGQSKAPLPSILFPNARQRSIIMARQVQGSKHFRILIPKSTPGAGTRLEVVYFTP